MVLTVDYLRNVGTHYLLNIDENHTGDSAYLNVPAAQAAIAATNTSFGCVPGTAGIGCAILAGATINDYATNGLDSTGDLNGLSQCGGGLPASYPVACAFGGINPLIGGAPFLEPVGRSVYNAMAVKWVDNVRNPFKGVHYLNFQVAYALSRFQNTGSSDANDPAGAPSANDQDFPNYALDYRNPNRYFGDSALDRTHQLNMGGWAELPGGFRIGLISHLWSPLPQTPFVSNGGMAAIYQSDFSGSGVTGDPLPIAQTSSTCGDSGGACSYTQYHTGAFGRGLTPNGLNNAVANYNTTIAGKTVTPAGQALINAGLFTDAQLIALGATPQAIDLSNPSQVSLGWLKAFDLEISYHRAFFNERVTLTPSVAFFNVFNFVNYDGPSNTILGGLLNGAVGSIFGTPPNTQANLRPDRIGTGTGVFAFGAPRVIEWGLKMQF
jgi:hypothetical protein